jgi:GntR family transcriptional repressor for pyruvate dehydrogenase complex
MIIFYIVRHFSFTQIRPQRLTDGVRNRLISHIVSGNYAVGTRLPDEESLANQFGVSLIVIKQALSALEALGLIVKKRGRKGGLFVGEPGIGPVKILLKGYLGSQKFTRSHFQELRSIIEPVTARLAALRADESLLLRLRKNVKKQAVEEKAMRQRPSRKRYLDMQVYINDFHRLIAEASGNPLLILVVDYLMDALTAIASNLYVDYSAEVGQKIVQEHQKILSVIARGDADTSERLMVKHIGWAGEELGILERRREILKGEK